MIFGASGFSGGFAVGFATGFLSREIMRLSAGLGRPVLRAVVKTGVAGVEKSRESLAHWGESFEDLVAEVRSSLAESSPLAASMASSSSAESGSGREKERDREKKADSSLAASLGEERPRKKTVASSGAGSSGAGSSGAGSSAGSSGASSAGREAASGREV